MRWGRFYYAQPQYRVQINPAQRPKQRIVGLGRFRTVVNTKCIVCHPGWKVGEVIGAVSYKLPID
jgi:hypothetical protein